MGATKFEIYTEELIRLSELAKAISHPARLKAVLIIANETDEDVTLKDIMEEIDLAQSTLSQHLKVLRDAGLVMTKLIVENNTSKQIYRINKLALEQINKLLNHLSDRIDLKQDDRFNAVKSFYSRLYEITNWNQCFNS
ncbi:helix-turn-helix transcriptional regulator [Crocinitomicaceae bacterium CZZ-1]|uniref:Helix-turn-helix transcriptional regulator n=1 Tax=Taishania pollutisoli TaxID=2766479 RepID=A0A8J6TTL6_9FLAO|nr:ArsR family transcriptional regulator [Taishania pollutisoli]MBC9813297.1 helix-turn-helix transcriptional regulator [Taishania pollutisoli]